MEQQRRIAVVGGGASGVLAAVAIGHPARPVAVFEPRPELGRGYAYSTTRREHLLNVPAGRLSVDPSDPADFVRWCSARGLIAESSSFLPRSVFGSYLADRSRDRAEHRMTRVVDVERRADGRFDVVTDDGRRDHFDDVVVATGYGSAPGDRTFPWVESPLIVRNPYGASAFDNLAATGPIVVLGTGLTAVDVMLTLAAERPGQHVVAVSRRGRTPTLHDIAAPPLDVTWRPSTARELVRRTRAVVATVEADGGDWRSVVDGLRAELPEIWRSLPDVERDRLLRHARRPWELHRHRLAPAVAKQFADLLAQGRISIRRGRPTAVGATASGLSVEVTHAGTTTTIEAGGMVVCTGVIDDDWVAACPLLRRLLERDLVVTDPLGIGPAVDRRGRLLGPTGAPTGNLWAIGPIRRAAEWEATAIPEIRRQAAELATELSN